MNSPAPLEGGLLERLAEAAHDDYCAGRKRDGWTYGPVRDNAAKKHPLLVPYAEIPEEYKESNRNSVREIPRKLAVIDCEIVPAEAGKSPYPFRAEDVEKMSVVEHDIWMEDKIRAGFTLGEPTPESPNRTPGLIPYADLTEDVKQLDRNMVVKIPAILALAGYVVVKRTS